jgi:hypothetical protein
MAIELQRTLSELSDLVPVVPPRASELLQAAEALRRRTDDRLGRASLLPDAAAELGDALEETARQALEDVRDADEERRERLTELQEANVALAESLEEWAEDLEEATQDARRSLGELQQAFASDGRLTESETGAAGSTDAAGRQYLAGAERYREVERGFGEAHERLGTQVLAVTGVLAAAFASLVERIHETQEQIDEGIGALKDATEAAQEELRDTLESAMVTTAASLQAAGDEFRDGLLLSTAAMRERTGQACAAASQGGDGLRAAGASAELAQGVLDPLFEGVAELLQPVEAAVGAVKAAAGLVGLNLD